MFLGLYLKSLSRSAIDGEFQKRVLAFIESCDASTLITQGSSIVYAPVNKSERIRVLWVNNEFIDAWVRSQLNCFGSRN